MKYKEIESEAELLELLQSSQFIAKKAFQSVDFEKFEQLLKDRVFEDCIFLGCTVPASFDQHLKSQNLVFPKIQLPFNPYRGTLYDRETLYKEYIPGDPETYKNTFDNRVYEHYIRKGKEAGDIKETLSRRLHDHAITDALYDFLAAYPEKKVVAVMGGHSLSRADINFLEIAKISKGLTEQGYLMVSGGGPGAMEATHVGAWFAGRNEIEMERALKILAEAPHYKDELWLEKAFQVITNFEGGKSESLGIPTWLYGHEPPTPFASKIAKYFANSVREDGLLTIAKGGVIFAPGSAGTVQEIFQDATQNHYLSFGYASPMVFFDANYWTREIPVYPLFTELVEKGKYQNMILSLCNTREEVIAEIQKFSAK